MSNVEHLNELRQHGKMMWVPRDAGWKAEPREVVDALAGDGFEEYKREEARSGRGRTPSGGVWQGLNRSTGAVASAVWITRPAAQQALVFIDIDGQPLQGGEEEH
jgi:hypothetical protein